MTKEEKFQQAMKEFGKTPSVCFPAEVQEVDKEALTCVVSPINGAEMFDVRLKASVNSVTDGIVQFPVEGTTVLVCLIGNDPELGFVAAVDEVDEVLMFGGENGGLTITPKLVEELNKTNARIDAIVESLTGFMPVPNDGGAALKTYANAQLAGKANGDFSEIENEKIRH
ncbi:hypothetical protein [Roseivirga sp. UBA1976]|uniref:hypothetical protein n=1 Tax=Roseivirga sp. UBA1976 TaxID=1947386 RepID=UPI00257FF1BA|nr:hypothetical protein [Roseivirga sp. UBA1976]